MRFCACYFFASWHICSPIAVSKSNNVEQNRSLDLCNSAVPMQRDGRSMHACAELKNRIRAYPHVRLGHGSKDTAHVRVDTSILIFACPSHTLSECSMSSVWLKASKIISHDRRPQRPWREDVKHKAKLPIASWQIEWHHNMRKSYKLLILSVINTYVNAINCTTHELVLGPDWGLTMTHPFNLLWLCLA